VSLHTREEFERLEERVKALKADYDEAVREIRRLVQAKADLEDDNEKLANKVARLERKESGDDD
jgi:DNA-binding ferritin-like protein (Dps family)